MAKRGNGEGSVYRRKDGKWVAAITLPPYLGGKKKTHYGKTRKECVEWLEETRHSLKTGEYTTNSEITFKEWLDTWYSDYCINIRPATRMNYDTYINRHIGSSEIANLPLHQVDVHFLQIYLNNLHQNGRIDGNGGLSPKTVRNLFNMLHKAFKQAVGNKLILSNPADYVVLPKITKPSVRVLDIQEQNQLLEACRGERWEIAVQLSLGTGLRIGELLALRHSDVLISDNIPYLNISKSLQRVKDYYGETDGYSTVLHESSTKTENSVRQIPLSPVLADMLNRHIAYQKSKAEVTYGLYNNDPYIISNELGECIDPGTYRKWFKTITEKAGLSGRVTPHTLRHSFASSALKYGMNLKNISDILGHYSTDFTARTYIHTDLKGKYDAILSMDKDIKSEERRDDNEYTLLS